jgi:hypothetical protein
MDINIQQINKRVNFSIDIKIINKLTIKLSNDKNSLSYKFLK